MTDEQILKKAIEKAIKNGWKKGKLYLGNVHYLGCGRDAYRYYYAIIYNRDFAKAIWGEEIKCHYCDLNQEKHKIIIGKTYDECSNCGLLVEGDYLQESWKTHIEQMVLEKEPLKYLEKFL